MNLFECATPSKDTIILFGREVHRDAMVRFKSEYELAKKNGQEVFMHADREVLVSFAKYVIEYAESQMGEL